jgi:hypothetical protein
MHRDLPRLIVFEFADLFPEFVETGRELAIDR